MADKKVLFQVNQRRLSDHRKGYPKKVPLKETHRYTNIMP